MDTPIALDANTRAALQKLADISLPPEVSLFPSTWGWGVVAVAFVAALAMALLLWLRHLAANRYRREALAELNTIEAGLAVEGTRVDTIRSIPPLLKRVALAAWPCVDVAALSGADWWRFLQANDDRLSDDLHALLDGVEYRGDASIVKIDEREARSIVSATRQWIVGHHGPA